MSEIDNQEFTERFLESLYKKLFNPNQSLNICLAGKVGTGKSSLLNAILQRTKETVVSEVGAKSGVTTKLKVMSIDSDDKVCFVDTPGLDDVRAENSQVTKDFLKNIDVGIFVIEGSSDKSQKKNCDDLKKNCQKMFVVLNKADEWDDLDPTALEDVINQWKTDLQVDHIYPTVTKGFDPRSIKMDIRGVDQLRSDVDEFLSENGKDLLLARHMRDKKSKAVSIIASALIAVAGQAFLPGSTAYIVATQGATIASLVYLYTGKIISKSQIMGLLPAFATAVAPSLLIWVESFLPPTGIFDLASAVTAVTITLAMLTSVNAVLYSGEKLTQTELLRSKFEAYRTQATKALKELSLADWKELTKKSFWLELVEKIVESRM